VSKLAVGQLEGLASEGYRISVASGSAFAPAGAILQVVSTNKTDTFTSTSTSYTDVTGLSVTITPKFDTSKILVVVHIGCMSINGTGFNNFQIVRGSTAIAVGDTAGSRTRSSIGTSWGNNFAAAGSAMFFDSPATTSATTYKIQGLATSTQTFYVNRTATDTDSASWPRTSSTITVLEVAG
jgi:hypothetical protein